MAKNKFSKEATDYIYTLCGIDYNLDGATKLLKNTSPNPTVLAGYLKQFVLNNKATGNKFVDISVNDINNLVDWLEIADLFFKG